MPKLERFEIIIRKYKALRKANPDLHILNCVMQNNLLNAIIVAARAIDSNEKIHSHQRRVGEKVLGEFANNLVLAEIQISNAKSFDEIISIVSENRIPRIGELTIYDTSARIGEYLKIYPSEVYLHAGTRIGARNIFGNIRGKKKIPLKEFPPIIQHANLTIAEIEDILCIYKNDLKLMKFL